MARIYVASSWRNEYQPIVVETLRAVHHEVYDFRHPAPGNEGFSWRQTETPGYAHGDKVDAQLWRRMVDHPVAVGGWRLDFEAMKAADACVLVIPAGRSASYELGWCEASGKRCAVLALEPTEPELMFRTATILGTMHGLIEWAAGRAR